MSTLSLKIENLRGINTFEINVPIKRGIHIICGSNGIGKSTVMTTLSKIVYRNALNKYFKHSNDTAVISYAYADTTNTWKPNARSSWSMTEKSVTQINFDGIFESSFIYGNRFTDAHKSKIGKILSTPKEEFIDADQFVYEWLGFILKDNKKYYSNLKKTKPDFDLKKLDLTRPMYALITEDSIIHQCTMSSGEYLIISLLDYLKERLDTIKNDKKNEPAIVILDEADLALHPASQERLIEFFEEIYDQYNLCVYISTHSPVIISRINKEDIFLLDKDEKNNIEVIYNCYPGYAMRDVSLGYFFDRIILVEDVLAKAYIEKILRDKLSHLNALFQVLCIGGYSGVINFHREAMRIRLGGAGCKIMSILDGDVQTEVEQKFKDDIQAINLCFLPIDSLEKFLYKNIIETKNRELFQRIENSFFRQKGLKKVIESYTQNTQNTSQKELKKGKKLWEELKAEALKQGATESRFIDFLCDLALKEVSNESLESRLLSFLQKNT